MSRYVDLDERVTAQFYDQECEEWTMQTVTIEDVLDSVCDEYTVLPSAESERLTDDDFETIRIHLNAYKEKLCNQQRWEEAEEYQRIIDRFMAFASAQPDVPDTNVGNTEITEEAIKEYCRKRCLTIVTNDYFHKLASAQPVFRQRKDCAQPEQESLLIIKSNVLLKKEQFEAYRKMFMEQKDDGVVLLPSAFDAQYVPSDVEIRMEGQK